MNALTIPLIVFSLISGESADLSKVQISEKTYRVSVADSAFEQMKGLMGREQLGADEGMLFIYEKDRAVQFWMKGVPFPVDMIFLDSCGKIVQIREKAQPDDTTIIASNRPVRAVLELRGGASKRDQIRIGDAVRTSHDFFETC